MGRFIFFMIYKSLFKRKILKKYWTFFCVSKYTFNLNYTFINSFYSKTCFTDVFLLILSLRRLIPFFLSLLKNNDSLLFIGSQFLYARSLSKAKIVAHVLNNRNPGIFSNFSITGLYSIDNISLKFLPKIIFFFYLGKHTLLLQEAKNKNLPVVALTNIKENICLVDYPIPVDSDRFSNTYFFSVFFFRFLQFS